MKSMISLLTMLMASNIFASEWRKRPTKFLQQSFSKENKTIDKQYNKKKWTCRAYLAYLASCYMVQQKDD